MSILGGLFACTPQSAIPKDAAPQTAIGTGGAVPMSAVEGTAGAVTGAVVKPTAGALFVFDEWMDQYASGGDAPSTLELMSLYQKSVYSYANWVPITGWSGLFDLLLTYSEIDQLVFFSHGVTGSIYLTIPPGEALLDGTVVSKVTMDSVPLINMVEALVARAGAENLPCVGEWIFEGCHVGMLPRELAAVKTAFQSTRVSGYNLNRKLHYWSLPKSPNGRTDQQYAVARADHDSTAQTPYERVPVRDSTLYLPGMNDLSDTIGSTTKGETMWEYFTTTRNGAYVEIDRVRLQDVYLTTYQAEQQYLYANETDAHRIIVED